MERIPAGVGGGAGGVVLVYRCYRETESHVAQAIPDPKKKKYSKHVSKKVCIQNMYVSKMCI